MEHDHECGCGCEHHDHEHIVSKVEKAEFIEYQIRKYMKFRLADLTHEQVQEMQQQVNRIARTHALDKEPTAPKDKTTEFKHGKRGDHDSLPPEIQALYVENASIMQKMRELHLRLRTLSTAISRFSFLPVETFMLAYSGMSVSSVLVTIPTSFRT